MPGLEVSEARQIYLAHYENSRYWVDFEDFSFYPMDVLDIYYVGGFGVMGWVPALEYHCAQPDPLAASRFQIILHVNTEHKGALIQLGRVFAGVEAQDATMTSVDRLGFQLRLKIEDGMRSTRIAFLRAVSNPTETREVLIDMVRRARQH
jgi:heme iron utilization protein